MMRVHDLSRVLPALLSLVVGGGVRVAQAADGGRPVGEEERQAIAQVGIEMLAAWYGADPAKLERVLHPDLAKRGVLTDEAGVTRVVHMDKERFLAATREGRGRLPEEEWQISAEILDLGDNIASVKVTSQYLVDVCQLAKLGGEWKVVNVLWHTRKTPPWFED